MSDVTIHNESAAKLSEALQELAQLEANLEKLDARLNELEANAGSDAQARARAAARVLADDDDQVAREHLNELHKRAREREDMRATLPQVRAEFVRQIELAKRKLELAKPFAQWGANIASFPAIAAMAQELDNRSAQLASAAAAVTAAAEELRALGLNIGNPAEGYTAPSRTASETAAAARDHWGKRYAEAKRAIERFEADPLTVEEESARLRGLVAKQAEDDRLREAEAKRKAEREKAEAWERERDEAKRKEQLAAQNAEVFRMGDPANQGRIIDLTPGSPQRRSRAG